MLFAGFAAAQGMLNPFLLLVATGLGSFAGDQSCFWVGRHFGSRLLDRFPRWRFGVDAALRWLERYDTGFILSFRFIYGVRNFSSFAMGMSAVRGRRFLALNFLAAGAVGGELYLLSAIFSATRFARFSAILPARSAWRCWASLSRSAPACGSLHRRAATTSVQGSAGD